MQNLPQLSQNEIILQIAQANVEIERRLETIEHRMEESQGQLETAIKIFAAPREKSWYEDMDDAIKAFVKENCVSPLKFRGVIYQELESLCSVDLDSQLTRLRNRIKKQGATYKERKALTKLHIISNDKALRAIFESILRKYKALYSVGYCEEEE